MSDLSKQLGNFSQQKRRLLTLRLRERLEKTGKRQEIPVLPRNEDHDTFPFSFSQECLWVLHQINEDSAAAYI